VTAAPAAPPAPAPVAPLPARAASPPSADHFAFATVLDSLPGAAANAGAPTAENPSRPSDEPQGQSPRGQPARHSLLGDGSLLASLPFALHAPSMTEGPEAVDKAPSPGPAAGKGAESEASTAAIAAGASTSGVGRLIGQRAFHFAASMGPFASRTQTSGAPLGAAEAASAAVLANAASAIETPPTAASIAPHPGGAATNHLNPARTAAHTTAHSAAKADGSAPPPAARASGSVSPPAPAGSHARAVDGRLPDPTPSAAPSPTQPSLFGAELSAPLAASASFESDASATKSASVDVAPTATALTAPSTQPIKEIDVDLSPGGLEDVSMTMRLAGDRLSVVLRAASSQTLGSIEGARDAITDRMAAIGQPLDSLIVKQTGANANANGATASAEDGSTGETGRSVQGTNEWSGSNDALSRRGAGRDRSF
jgi:Flagellar hook-length control protein FliK